MLQALPENPITAESAELDWPGAQSLTAQGIHCGPWPLAFSYTWANTIVEQFDLVPIPRAPMWLLGSINLDGHIVPVIDMAAYLQPEADTATTHQRQRLLVGGIAGDSHESALALLFSGLPMQIQYERVECDKPDLPERLTELCTHISLASNAGQWLEIQTDRLYDTLLLDLIQL